MAGRARRPSLGEAFSELRKLCSEERYGSRLFPGATGPTPSQMTTFLCDTNISVAKHSRRRMSESRRGRRSFVYRGQRDHRRGNHLRTGLETEPQDP